MKIQHRITFAGKEEARLKNIGVAYKISPLPYQKVGLVHIDIEESSTKWPLLNQLVKETNGVDIFDTVFSEQEILEAEWCRIIPVFERGYPQPEATWLKERGTYEGYCSECGTFKRQKDLFRIKKEPKLGKNQFMSLFWTYALFAQMEVFSEFESNNFAGFEKWETVVHSTNSFSQLIAQLRIPNVTEAKMLDNIMPHKVCTTCGTKKYLPHMRGYMEFEAQLRATDYDFLLSKEWFGDGGSAFREILVSKKVVKLIIKNKWAGIRIKPVQIKPIP